MATEVGNAIDTSNDSILYYNVGEWGPWGLAVPNWANKVATNNLVIKEFVETFGQALTAMMFRDEAAISRPPSMNVVSAVHQLYKRGATLLTNRAVPENKMLFDPGHSTPPTEPFRVYPVPYFTVRNKWMKRWCGMGLRGIGHMMQHSENRISDNISVEFARSVMSYLFWIYKDMCVDLFQLTPEVVEAPNFLLSEEHFKSYAPSNVVLSVERIDTSPSLAFNFTEDRISVLSNGIFVTQLPALRGYPTNPLAGVNQFNPDLTGTVSQSPVPTVTAAGQTILAPATV